MVELDNPTTGVSDGDGVGRRLLFYLALGVCIGFAAVFFRTNQTRVLDSRNAELVLYGAQLRLETYGPRFGSEDHMGEVLSQLDMACELAQPGQRMESRIGDWLAERGFHSEASNYYLRALQRRPSLALARRAGEAAVTGRNTDAAAAAYGIVMELAPRDPDAYNLLGYYYAVEGIRLDEAERLVKRALELVPPDETGSIAAYEDSLAWVYYRQGRYAEAWEHMTRATLGGVLLYDPVITEHYHAIREALEASEAGPPKERD